MVAGKPHDFDYLKAAMVAVRSLHQRDMTEPCSSAISVFVSPKRKHHRGRRRTFPIARKCCSGLVSCVRKRNPRYYSPLTVSCLLPRVDDADHARDIHRARHYLAVETGFSPHASRPVSVTITNHCRGGFHSTSCSLVSLLMVSPAWGCSGILTRDGLRRQGPTLSQSILPSTHLKLRARLLIRILQIWLLVAIPMSIVGKVFFLPSYPPSATRKCLRRLRCLLWCFSCQTRARLPRCELSWTCNCPDTNSGGTRVFRVSLEGCILQARFGVGHSAHRTCRRGHINCGFIFFFNTSLRQHGLKLSTEQMSFRGEDVQAPSWACVSGTFGISISSSLSESTFHFPICGSYFPFLISRAPEIIDLSPRPVAVFQMANSPRHLHRQAPIEQG